MLCGLVLEALVLLLNRFNQCRREAAGGIGSKNREAQVFGGAKQVGGILLTASGKFLVRQFHKNIDRFPGRRVREPWRESTRPMCSKARRRSLLWACFLGCGLCAECFLAATCFAGCFLWGALSPFFGGMEVLSCFSFQCEMHERCTAWCRPEWRWREGTKSWLSRKTQVLPIRSG